MRMAHLYDPNPTPQHHEIHLTEAEARSLTSELQQSGWIWQQAGERPTLFRIFHLLAARNTHHREARDGHAFSYYTHRSLQSGGVKPLTETLNAIFARQKKGQ